MSKKLPRVIFSTAVRLLFVFLLFACCQTTGYTQTEEDKKARSEFMKDSSRAAEDARAKLRALKDQQDVEKADREAAADKRLRNDAIREFDRREFDRQKRGEYSGGEIFWYYVGFTLFGGIVGVVLLLTCSERRAPWIVVATTMFPLASWGVCNNFWGNAPKLAILLLVAMWLPFLALWLLSQKLKGSRKPKFDRTKVLARWDEKKLAIEENAAADPSAIAFILARRAKASGHWVSLMVASVAFTRGYFSTMDFLGGSDEWLATVTKENRFRLLTQNQECVIDKVRAREFMKESLKAFAKDYGKSFEQGSVMFKEYRKFLNYQTSGKKKRQLIAGEDEIHKVICDIELEQPELGQLLMRFETHLNEQHQNRQTVKSDN